MESLKMAGIHFVFYSIGSGQPLMDFEHYQIHQINLEGWTSARGKRINCPMDMSNGFSLKKDLE